MSSYEQSSDFSLWESEFDTHQNDDFLRCIERILIDCEDPLDAAKKLSTFSDNFSRSSRDSVLRECISQLNYYYMARYVTDVVTVDVYEDLGQPSACQACDMADLIIELQKTGSTRVSGRLGFFEKHRFSDHNSSVDRSELCLRMYDSAFLRLSGDEPVAIQIPNYVTIPIHRIGDYKLHHEE